MLQKLSLKFRGRILIGIEISNCSKTKDKNSFIFSLEFQLKNKINKILEFYCKKIIKNSIRLQISVCFERMSKNWIKLAFNWTMQAFVKPSFLKQITSLKYWFKQIDILLTVSLHTSTCFYASSDTCIHITLFAENDIF